MIYFMILVGCILPFTKVPLRPNLVLVTIFCLNLQLENLALYILCNYRYSMFHDKAPNVDLFSRSQDFKNALT